MTDNAQAWTVYNSLMVDPLTHTVYSAGEAQMAAAAHD